MNAGYDRVVVGTARGRVLHCFMEDFSAVAAEDADLRVNAIREFHSGRALGACSVPTESQEDVAVTVGEDGRVLLYDGDDEKARAKVQARLLVEAGEDGETALEAVKATAVCAFVDRPVVALGFSSGHVALAALIKEKSHWEMRYFWTTKVSAGAVSSIAAADGVLAVATGAEGKVFIIDTSILTNATVTAHGATRGGAPVTALAWYEGKNKMIIFADAGGLLYTMRASGGRSAELQKAQGTFAAPEGLPITDIIAFPPMGKGVHLVASPRSKSMLAIKVSGGKTDADAAPAAVEVAETWAHEAGLTALAMSHTESTFVVGDAEGAVYVYNIIGGVLQLEGSDRFSDAPVLKLAVMRSNSKALATYLDGTAVSFSSISLMAEIPAPANSVMVAQPRLPYLELDNREEPWIVGIAAKEAEARQRKAADALRKKREKVAEIAETLQELLEQNDNAPEMERLELEEFVVDEEGAGEKTAAIAAEADALRTSIKQRDDDIQVLAARVRELVYDPLEVPLCVIETFLADAEEEGEEEAMAPVRVENFAVPKTTPQDKKQLERIKKMRALELRSTGAAGSRAWHGLLDEVPESIGWVLNEGVLKLEEDIVSTLNPDGSRKDPAANDGDAGEGDADDDDEEDGGADAAPALDENDLKTLLYPPAAVRTPHQHRVQIFLLKTLITNMKRRFNARFDELKSDKQNCIYAVEEKNGKIKEILEELQSDLAFFKPTMAPEEQPESFLEVTDAELTTKPYETPAQAQARLEAEEKRKKEAAEKGMTMEQRALVDMMNGTLEVKKDSLATAQAPPPPEFMEEVGLEEMSDDQRKEVEEWEERLKSFHEEQDKHRKSLGLELKKLQTEVAEVVRGFNEKVETFARQRVQVLNTITSQEFYVARMTHSIAEDEHCEEELRRLEAARLSLRDSQIRLHERGVEFQQKVKTFKDELQRIQDDHRSMERNFKREMQEISSQPLDQDTLLILMETFQRPMENTDTQSSYSGPGSAQRRSGASSSRRPSMRGRQPSQRRNSRATRGSANSFADDKSESMKDATENAVAALAKETTSRLDPFNVADELQQKKYEALHAPFPDVAPAFIDPEMVEIVEPHVLDRLQQLRITKIHREMMIRRKNLELTALRKQNDRLLDEQDEVATKIARLEAERTALREAYAARKWDPTLVMALAQGQDESPAVAHKGIHDYDDAQLIAVNLVENINKSIRRLGDEKVKTLTKMKDYRKRINYMEWENQYMDMQERAIELKYKDLQLLRVTKNLQAALKGEVGAEKDRERVEKLEARMAVISKTHKNKIERTSQQTRKLGAQLRDRTTENARLLRQLRELETAVSVREGIYRSRLESSGGDATPEAMAATRMKRITVRRRLVDIARAQTDEIDYLRNELDRLRQRTFPSFAHAVPHMTGPDEMDR
uniref:Cilia- and flagella-associated protein 43 n=1 Tax=Phaeomonas parva TaxID=124430 RepID=A0A7S1UCA8_9STRA